MNEHDILKHCQMKKNPVSDVILSEGEGFSGSKRGLRC